MNHSGILTKLAPPSILSGTLFALYLRTMAPGLTWANHGYDGGDLITAAATGGVAHPTGYPVYLLLARFFQRLPIGSLAYRTNLMSAVFAVCAAVLVYAVVARALREKGEALYWLPALIAGFTFGFSPVTWSQAVITEVYTLHAFFVALIFFLFSFPDSARVDRLRGAALGLAMGNHITSILMTPAIMWLGSLRRKAYNDSLWDWFQSANTLSLQRQFIWTLAGISVYIILPIRAASSPAINWENPVNLENFLRLVSGQLYQGHYLYWSVPFFLQRVQAFAALLVEQFSFLGIFFGIVGGIVFFQTSKLYILSWWCFVSFSLFAFGYASVDSYLYLIPALIAWSIWIGLGIGGWLEASKKNIRKLAVTMSFMLLLLLSAFPLTNYREVDASQDFRAEDFGNEVMQRTPADALIFAEGDQAVFALWYFHFALGKRPDIVVLATDLLHYDWYQTGIRAQYPALILPDAFLWKETVMASNANRPICFVKYEDQIYFRCDVEGFSGVSP